MVSVEAKAETSEKKSEILNNNGKKRKIRARRLVGAIAAKVEETRETGQKRM